MAFNTPPIQANALCYRINLHLKLEGSIIINCDNNVRIYQHHKSIFHAAFRGFSEIII